MTLGGKGGGEREVVGGWRGGESVRAAEQCPLPSYTAAPPHRIGLQPPRWRRQEWCSPTFKHRAQRILTAEQGGSRQAGRQAGRQGPGGVHTCIKKKKGGRGPTLVAGGKSPHPSMHAPRPVLYSVCIHRQEASSLLNALHQTHSGLGGMLIFEVHRFID